VTGVTHASSSAASGFGLSQWLARVAAVLVGMVAWQLIVWLSDGWVPSLSEVGVSLIENLTSRETYQGALITLRRLGIAFVGSTVVGVTLGFLMGLLPSFDAFWRPLVVTALAIPDPVYFIAAILILGTAETVSLLALTLAVIPFVTLIVFGAVGSRDQGLDEMAKVYRLPRSRYLIDVLGRQLVPGLLAAARTSFAFSWKIVVLMEALTQPNGIGFQIYNRFRLLRPHDMIALAIIFILIMQVVERLVFTTAEKRLLAWQR
jgi:ABC-type nitrate/sulfonate/bicarbonate transport system permease component